MDTPALCVDHCRRWLAASGLDYGHCSREAFARAHPSLFGWAYEVTLRGRGKKVHKLRLVDRSRVAALQDAEVRALAARYGDPDDLLNVDWVPDRPGINVPGDYEKDFGRDPVSYWQRTKEMILAGTYPFLLQKTFPVVK